MCRRQGGFGSSSGWTGPGLAAAGSVPGPDLCLRPVTCLASASARLPGSYKALQLLRSGPALAGPLTWRHSLAGPCGAKSEARRAAAGQAHCTGARPGVGHSDDSSSIQGPLAMLLHGAARDAASRRRSRPKRAGPAAPLPPCHRVRRSMPVLLRALG